MVVVKNNRSTKQVTFLKWELFNQLCITTVLVINLCQLLSILSATKAKQFLCQNISSGKIQGSIIVPYIVSALTQALFTLPFQCRNNAQILHIVVCVKVTDVESVDNSSDAPPEVFSEPQQRWVHVCVNGKDERTDQESVGLMVFTVWRLNPSFNHQFKEKWPTKQQGPKDQSTVMVLDQLSHFFPKKKRSVPGKKTLTHRVTVDYTVVLL